MLQPEHRLTKPREFSVLYHHGSKEVGKHLVIYYLKKNQAVNRFGFIVSKKVGNAVVRNRIKRKLREIVRHHPVMHQKGFDMVLIARSNCVDADYQRIAADAHALFARIGFSKESDFHD